MTPRDSELGFRMRRLPSIRTVSVTETVAGLHPVSFRCPRAEGARGSPGRDAHPTAVARTARTPAPLTHKDSRCLSCCSCCASCRRRFCSRRRCSSCSGGSRGRRDPVPDDIEI